MTSETKELIEFEEDNSNKNGSMTEILPEIPITASDDQKDTKSAKPVKELSIKDKAILMLAKENPGLSTRQIGLHLKDLGIVKHENTVYKRLSKSDYLRREIDAIRANTGEFVSRELVPVALKIHHKKLKEIAKKKEPEPGDKDWVFQAEKMEFKLDDLKRDGGVKQINIENIEKVQIILADMAQKRLEHQLERESKG